MNVRDVGAIAIGLRPAERLAARDLDARRAASRGDDSARSIDTFSAWLRAEELRHEVVEVHADRHRPGDRRGAQAARSRRHRQRRHLDVARVVEPRAVRAVLRIEDAVVDDAVDGRLDAGDERRVRRDRSPSAARRRRRRPRRRRARARAGSARSRAGVGVARRHQAVDRDQDDARVVADPAATVDRASAVSDAATSQDEASTNV